MKADLRGWWSGGASPYPRATLRRISAWPWCRPAPPLRPDAPFDVPFDVPPPAPLAPGETLLLGVREGKGELHVLRWTAVPNSPPLGAEAEAALRLAAGLATWAAPLLVDPHGHTQRPHAERIPGAHTEAPTTLDGASFGLAFALALASRAAGLPLPPHLAASACLGPGGHLGPVEGLAEKLAALAAWAPGVRVVLVCGRQVEAAREVAGSLEIVGVSTLQEAVTYAIPEQAEALVARLSELPEPERVFFALEALALGTTGGLAVPAWPQIERTIALLTPKLPAALHERAAFTGRVARRHHARTEVRLPWTPREAWPHRQIWLARLRQVVQAATDDAADDTEALDFARRALAAVPGPGERCVEGLRLVGAVGRALGAVGALAEAQALVEGVHAEWMSLDLPDEASYSLSEWLRLAPLLGDAAPAIGAARRWLADPRTSPVARAYVSTGLGRALVLAGTPTSADEAAQWLGAHAVPEQVAPGDHHLWLTRARWRARAYDQLGRDGDAERDALPNTLQARDYRVLAALDRAQRHAADPTPLLAQLHAPEVARLLRCKPPDRPLPAWVADAWRY